MRRLLTNLVGWGRSQLRSTTPNYAYSEEEHAREFKVLQHTSEFMRAISPHVLEEASRSLSNVLLRATKGWLVCSSFVQQGGV